MLGNFACLLSSADCYKINSFEKHHKSVKQFGARSGLTCCQARSWSKSFVKVISRQQKLPLASRERVKSLILLYTIIKLQKMS